MHVCKTHFESPPPTCNPNFKPQSPIPTPTQESITAADLKTSIANSNPQVQLRDLGIVLLDTKAELQLALEEADAAAVEAADRTRDAHAAGHLAATAQAAAERSQAREREVAATAAAAEAARQLAVAEVAGLREEREQVCV